MMILDAVIQGMLLGGQYALFAAGLSLMFGVMRLVNLAHGDFAVMAAYGTLIVINAFAVSPVIAVLVVAPVVAVLGYVLQRFLLQKTLTESPLPSLLVTFGLSIIIQNVLLMTMSADQRRMTLGAVDTASLTLPGDIRIGVFPLTVFLFAVVVMAALSWTIAQTHYGRLVRAVSDDPATVELSGVAPHRVYATAAAIAFGLVAVAGTASGIQTSFSPMSGSMLLIFAFEAVIIGGLGSLWGTLAGAMILGVAQTIGASFAPAHQILAGHLVFLLFLAFLPRGLTRKAGTV
ncbi:branched-chain amino acid ABC transporter permease [Arthrobacter sp. zg-ZUI100]|uniref:branched-chain amino acid ABC transporter permease n=1 Tax=Arthrobacter jiangjiafuii TaxID=2817475 RepID=UPI001AEE6049|nr:branched-chain amino acid ABC transporter permease [Arthrobacter jiangjiafuii]MBP3035895.1 branched-chain amino acid ABC transporter permease [Arthrobacter jiangjiafuii]